MNTEYLVWLALTIAVAIGGLLTLVVYDVPEIESGAASEESSADPQTASVPDQDRLD